MPATAIDPNLSELARAIALTVAYAPGSNAMFDRDMRYIAASPRYHADYFPDGMELVGRLHYEVFTDIPERWKAIHRRGLAGEKQSSEHDLFARAHGEVQTLKWTLEPWREIDGSIGGIIIATENLTITQAESAAREIAARELQALFEQHVTGIVVTDSNGIVLRANQRFGELVERDLGDIVGHRFDHAVQPTDRIELFDGFARLRAGLCRTLQGRHRVTAADGSPIWLNHELSRIDSGRGQPAMMVMFVSDATARVELEQRLRESDRLASLGMLGASLGHDMNNVLLPLRAHTNAVEAIVRREAPNATVASSLESIREGVAYLQHLADGMHYLAMEEASVPSSDGTELADWWEVVEPMFRTVMPRRASFEFSRHERARRVAMDAHDLTRSVLNLLSNARDAVCLRHDDDLAQAEVRIAVTPCTKARRRFVSIRVSDNGGGMSEAVRARACEPFFTTKPSGRGTGLGLPAVRRAVELAGGAMSIQSEPGVGTSVELVLPVAV